MGKGVNNKMDNNEMMIFDTNWFVPRSMLIKVGRSSLINTHQGVIYKNHWPYFHVSNTFYLSRNRYEDSINPLQSHKMAEFTQTIRRQQPTNCLGVFDHFVGLALKVLS